MTMEDLLRDEEAAILEEAALGVARLEHYRRDGAQATRGRLELLYRQLVDLLRLLDARANHGVHDRPGQFGPELRRHGRAPGSGTSRERVW